MRRSSDPRGEWTRRLLIAGLILLASIELGRVLGFRILAKAVEQTPVLPVVRYTPVPQQSLAPVQVRNWKTHSVVQVAPDPHFPDPHVTAAPPPPSPAPRTPGPRQSRSPRQVLPRTPGISTPTSLGAQATNAPVSPTPIGAPPTPFHAPDSGP